jgi:hypothetical protein
MVNENETQGLSRDGFTGKAITLVETAGSSVGSVLGDDHIVVKKTKKVWQYFLLYPAVFAAVLGCIPTGINIYKSLKYGVATDQVAHAEEQKALWVKNLHCVQSLSYQTMQTEDGSTVQIGACKNGDVLIELIPQGSDQSIAEWVSMSRVRSAGVFGSLLFPSAFAAEAADGAFKVAQAAGAETMCSNLDDATGIMIRVMKYGTTCFREEVDTLKGKVKKTAVSCDTPCK